MAGIPDIHVTMNGLSLWIEVKGDGGKVSKLQEEVMGEITAAGGAVIVAKSVDDVRNLIESLRPE